MDDEDKYPSQLADRFQVRMPPGLRERIARAAMYSGRSMNTEIVQVLEKHFPPEPTEQEVAETVLYYLNALEGSNLPKLRSDLYEELMRHKPKIEKQRSFHRDENKSILAGKARKRGTDLDP
ncbi:MAG: Arc family DNA-binding protein [Methylorubrum populi]